MPTKRQRRLIILALALAGTLLGAACGYWLGRVTLLRTAAAGLNDYADELVQHANEYARELTVIRKTFNPSHFGYCSPEELQEMKELTFRSLQVKEIGRTRDGKLYCTAFLGVLKPPLEMPPMTMILPGGTRVYSNVPLQVAGTSRGTILENGGVDMVLSPTGFDHWKQPHVRQMILVVNPATRQVAQVGGEKLDVDPAWVFGQGEKRVAGQVYRSRCSQERPVCVVTAEATIDMLANARGLLLGYTVMGCLAGSSLSFAMALFYLQRKGLAQQLRRAIKRNELWLVYQPVFDLETRRMVGAEALARWADEDGKMVAPDFFVRVAEEKGYISELTALVVRRATRELRPMLVRDSRFTLSINIAAADLEGEALFMLLEKHVQAAEIDPGQIALELTERSTANLDVVRQAIVRLHRAGYKVHIDDFGTGFSSLSYLHELDVDAIKIDRAFTQTIGTDAVTASVLPQMLAMAEALQLGVIVEGVEVAAQVEYLEAAARPMRIQGWYFGKPVRAGELGVFLKAPAVVAS